MALITGEPDVPAPLHKKWRRRLTWKQVEDVIFPKPTKPKPNRRDGPNKRVSEKQRHVRDAFKQSVSCFRAQPKAGGVIPPAIGPRARSWWYAAAEASGLWYFDYFMQQTLTRFLAHSTPEWCQCGSGWDMGANLLGYDTTMPWLADQIMHDYAYEICGFHNFDGENYRKWKFILAFDVGSIIWKNTSSCKITMVPPVLYDGTIFSRVQVSVIYDWPLWTQATWNKCPHNATYLTSFTPVAGASPTFYVGDAWKKCKSSGIMILLFEPEFWTTPPIGNETYCHFYPNYLGHWAKFEPCY